MDTKTQKVYFSKEHYGSWWVNELTDYYLFKTLNVKTNEIKNVILSWTRGTDINEEGKIVRVYDAEFIFEGSKTPVKYYFNFYYEDNRYRVESTDPLRLDMLLRDTDILFVGETENPDT